MEHFTKHNQRVILNDDKTIGSNAKWCAHIYGNTIIQSTSNSTITWCIKITSCEKCNIFLGIIQDDAIINVENQHRNYLYLGAGYGLEDNGQRYSATDSTIYKAYRLGVYTSQGIFQREGTQILITLNLELGELIFQVNYHTRGKKKPVKIEHIKKGKNIQYRLAICIDVMKSDGYGGVQLIDSNINKDNGDGKEEKENEQVYFILYYVQINGNLYTFLREYRLFWD